MNPIYWTLQHRVAWLIVSVTGAVAGVLFAYIQSPFFFTPQGWQVLEAWLRSPDFIAFGRFPASSSRPCFSIWCNSPEPRTSGDRLNGRSDPRWRYSRTPTSSGFE